MHAHINVWPLSDAGESSSDGIAREVAERLRTQPGFHAYTLVRTGQDEVVAVTLFETEVQLHSAVKAISDLTESNIHNVSAGKPIVHAGQVIYHEMRGA